MVVKTSSRCPNGEDESPAAGPPPQLRPQREGFSSCYSCTCSDTATVDADPTVDAPLVRPSEGSAAHQTDNSKQTHRYFASSFGVTSASGWKRVATSECITHSALWVPGNRRAPSGPVCSKSKGFLGPNRRSMCLDYERALLH
ncbi:hypothetical protein F441_05437 [Phytophthora nicotianae CJ01A1]|uniref:Uncharacterized protein n=3 Tax=Phytophthora nicotianae TaxID=4792 RepID=W2LM52_PHYNI|nr:hypothetical protein L915_05288 [Phytophthora nicotianae]ETO79974.1 hypothetical protein F444_05476 [Phytophthora nicotianae P1976]ETP20994.1 hypothetical protein F441_05437 [Phytophthora nicotianae CJ01A1]ETL44521.1 hypothetical protein L916_05242 [Phytophthora nicotianae]ETL97685.1 hypothetical protein L917_05126 [Phytophthora nicotianae]